VREYQEMEPARAELDTNFRTALYVLPVISARPAPTNAPEEQEMYAAATDPARTVCQAAVSASAPTTLQLTTAPSVRLGLRDSTAQMNVREGDLRACTAALMENAMMASMETLLAHAIPLVFAPLTAVPASLVISA